MKKKNYKLLALAISGLILLSGCGNTDNKNGVTPNATPTPSANNTDASEEDTLLEKAEKPEIEGRTMVDPDEIIYAENYSFEKENFSTEESVDCEIIVEAETIEATDNIVVDLDDSCSGGKYITVKDNSEFKLYVNLPASQFYKITATHKADGHKENPFVINGATVFNLYSESGDWAESVYDGIYLEAGDNVITLDSGWSWFSLDSLKFEKGESASDDLYATDDSLLSNPYANLKTQNIYQYLKAVYGKRTLAGQCTNYGHDTETEALYLGTGKYPAVRTFDFIFDSYNYCKGDPTAADVDKAIQWSKDGGLVVFDWHWYSPADGCSFYTKETEFTIPKAKPADDFDLTYMDFSDIQKLYKAGAITLETVMLYNDIDNIASLLQRMEDENVTVLWRPLHEASGGWFWWGATGAEDYKWLWKTLYERMTNYHGLDNLIWVWNAQDKDWYPGDEYCDIAAIDIYGPNHDYGTSPSVFSDMVSWTDGKKMVTMSECATMPDPDLIKQDNIYWLWFAVWNWDYIVVNGSTELSSEYTEVDMINKVYNSDLIITRDELPSFD